MNQAEDVMLTNPEEARELLDSIVSPEDLSNNQQARWCLLSSRLSDQQILPLPYSDQLVRAKKWYASYGTKKQEAEIGLYLGRAYVKDQSYENAAKTY